jgi:Eukaryotic aspartyl protease
MLTLAIFLLLADHVRALTLLPRRTPNTIPAPISVPVEQTWDGVDGQWNTIALRVGTPPQYTRVYISTASQQTWVIDPFACSNSKNVATCAESRGMLFQSNASTTFIKQGLYDLYILKNLNYSGNAQYGYDTIGLGYNGEHGPTVKNQTVGALAIDDFYFGHFGINPQPTNFTNINDNKPSYMSSLKAQNMIPSVSWGYTQGASYRTFIMQRVELVRTDLFAARVFKGPPFFDSRRL